MPTYNRIGLIGEAIDSVLRQSWQNFELIIVDDGSSDGTVELVRSFGDSRIRYTFQENSGQSSARNRGLGMVRGDFIAFLDSDNAWFETRLERHLKLLQDNPEYDLVYGVSVPYDGTSWKSPQNVKHRPSGSITRALLLRNFVPLNSVLMRRDLADGLGGFDESLRSAEDYDYWLRASLRGRFLADDEFSTLYRKTPGSISSDLGKNFSANEKILARFLARNPEFNDATFRRQVWGHFYAGVSAQWSGAGAHGNALKSAIQSIRSAPFGSTGYIAMLRSIALSARPGRTG